MRINYRTGDLEEYINWIYFFHAWSTPGDSIEAERLKTDALKLLRRLQPYLTVKAAVEVLPAYSEGDDIVVQKTFHCECGQDHTIGEPIRIPMLRQQIPGHDGLCLCLSDFIRPKSMLKQDKIGIFATSVHIDERQQLPDDDYNKMLIQTVLDRLAEAGAEKLHQETRTTYWGYAPNEHLTISQLHQEKFQGIRPAIGYPCLPDISINRIIDRIIDFASIGVTLTSSAMMQPHASVSGFMISLPQARYFSIGKIDDTQAADYARRRDMTVNEIKKYIQCC